MRDREMDRRGSREMMRWTSSLPSHGIVCTGKKVVDKMRLVKMFGKLPVSCAFSPDREKHRCLKSIHVRFRGVPCGCMNARSDKKSPVETDIRPESILNPNDLQMPSTSPANPSRLRLYQLPFTVVPRPAQTTMPNAATARPAITTIAPDKSRVLIAPLLGVLDAEEEDAEEVPDGWVDPEAEEEPEADDEAAAEVAVELEGVREDLREEF